MPAGLRPSSLRGIREPPSLQCAGWTRAARPAPRAVAASGAGRPVGWTRAARPAPRAIESTWRRGIRCRPACGRPAYEGFANRRRSDAQAGRAQRGRRHVPSNRRRVAASGAGRPAVVQPTRDSRTAAAPVRRLDARSAAGATRGRIDIASRHPVPAGLRPSGRSAHPQSNVAPQPPARGRPAAAKASSRSITSSTPMRSITSRYSSLVPHGSASAGLRRNLRAAAS